jgi:hypothetical protein
MTPDPYRSRGLTFAVTEEKVREELQAIQDRLAGGKVRPKSAEVIDNDMVQQQTGLTQQAAQPVADMLRHAQQQLELTQQYPGRDKP